ncbi:uncharacterized protein [Dysidea avara]|uniref:uncharacterized protein n=1 Tax=Dysidea avara TaxID=196820 RepID=UPI00331A503F
MDDFLKKRYFSADYLYTNGHLTPNCGLLSDKSIQCNYSSPFQQLLTVPVLPKDYTSAGTHVIAEVKLGIDSARANKHDTDFYLLLSDGYYANGFGISDHFSYRFNTGQPCFHLEGIPGDSLANLTTYTNGPKINVHNPVPQQFDFFFSTKQKWGSCITATAYEGSYTTSGHYTTELQANNGLYLDIYSEDDRGEVYNFKYIIVDIQMDY